MANGLLDFINTPEGQGLLSAAFGGLAGARRGQPLNSIGQAGLAGLSGYAGGQDRIQNDATNAIKNKYMQSQIDENVSQNAQRAMVMAQKQRQDDYFMGGVQPKPSPDAMPPGAFTPSLGGMGPVAPLSAQPQGGQPAGTPMAAQGGAAPTSGKFDEWSKQFGIPKDALVADYLNNGGKGISDMLYKRGAPDMQVANGYAYDKNKTGPGFMPSLSTSTNGQTSMTRIGPDGMPVVSAPQGALGTFGAYKGMEAGLGAAAKVNLRKNADGTEMPVSELDENPTLQKILGGGGQNAPQASAGITNPGNMRPPGASTGFAAYATPEAGLKALDGNLQSYGDKGVNTISKIISRWAPPSENNTAAYVSDVAKRLGVNPDQPLNLKDPIVRQALSTAITLHEHGPSKVFSAPSSQTPRYGMSNDQATTVKAGEARAVDTAKADVVRDTQAQTKTRNAGDTINSVDRAITLLGQKPTASTLGTLADKSAGVFGVSTNGANVAAQLDVVAADIVKNVPRFEGPQSDKDVDQYKSAAGRLSDRSLPVDQRLAAAEEVKLLQSRAVGGNKQAADTQKSSAKVLDALPTANASNKGQRIRDTTTGKILTSNGLQWKAE